MAPPPARWVLASAALPLLAGLALVLLAVAASDEGTWDALGYAVLAAGCGVLALLLPALALLAPGWDRLTRGEVWVGAAAAGLGTALLTFGLLAWVVELLDGGWWSSATALLLAAILAGLAVGGAALRRGVRRLRGLR